MAALASAVSAVADAMQTVQTVVRTFPSDAQGSQLGDGTPEWKMGFINEFTVGAFSLYGLVEIVQCAIIFPIIGS